VRADTQGETNWLVGYDGGVARDAGETKRRLLEAATSEFAERGIAGARVDRIAAAAPANKALIYSYFGNKEDLFDAVFNALVVDTVRDVPIDPDDLPGYAGRLFDRGQSHPQILRLALWHSLERGGAGFLPDAVVTANAEKVAAIARAQEAGRISRRFPAGELMALVVGLATLGAAELAPAPDPAVRRRTIIEAVELLTKDEA
jgi:AcrR family transcriptional regulator